VKGALIDRRGEQDTQRVTIEEQEVAIENAEAAPGPMHAEDGGKKGGDEGEGEGEGKVADEDEDEGEGEADEDEEEDEEEDEDEVEVSGGPSLFDYFLRGQGAYTIPTGQHLHWTRSGSGYGKEVGIQQLARHRPRPPSSSTRHNMLAARPMHRRSSGKGDTKSSLAHRKIGYAKGMKHDIGLRNQFVLGKSVFAPRKQEWASFEDSEVMLRRAFESDWGANKIDQLVKNNALRERLKEVVCESWPAIRYLFKHYAARYPPHFTLSILGFQHLCDDLRIRDTNNHFSPCSKNGLETLFIACTTRSSGRNDHSMSRSELLEMCVRLADAHYLKTKPKGPAADMATAAAAAAANGLEVEEPTTPQDIVEAFQAFKRKNLDLIRDYSTNEFRRHKLYSGPIDAVYQKSNTVLRQVFASCAKHDAGGKFIMLSEFLDLLKHKRLIGDQIQTSPLSPRRSPLSPRSQASKPNMQRQQSKNAVSAAKQSILALAATKRNGGGGSPTGRHTRREEEEEDGLVGEQQQEKEEEEEYSLPALQQVTEAEACVAFMESKLTVVDESKHSRHSEQLSFVDFLEVLARVAEIAFADMGPSVSTGHSNLSSFMESQEARKVLAQQIGALLLLLTASVTGRRLTKLVKAVKAVGMMR
jgi:hypothetical protein